MNGSLLLSGADDFQSDQNQGSDITAKEYRLSPGSSVVSLQYFVAISGLDKPADCLSGL